MTDDLQKIIEPMSVAGMHFGSFRSRRHPSTSSYIFDSKGQVEIINLEKSLLGLNRAKDFMRSLAEGRRLVLLVGNKNEARTAICDIA